MLVREQRPTISVVVCTYNSARFIETTVESCFEQTMQPLEVIVVDDGSTDATVEIVQRIASRQRSVQLIVNSHNKGLGAAMNTGVRLAQGDFVSFLEHDDYWLPFKLERDLEAILKHQGNGLQVVYSWGWQYTAHRQRITGVQPGGFSATTLRKSFLQQVGPFPESANALGIEDGYLVGKIMDLGDAGSISEQWKVELSEPGLLMVRREESLSAHSPEQSIRRYEFVLEQFPIQSGTRSRLWPWQRMWTMRLVWNLLLVGRRREALKRLKTCAVVQASLGMVLLRLLGLAGLPLPILRAGYTVGKHVLYAKQWLCLRRQRRQYIRSWGAARIAQRKLHGLYER